MFVKKTKKEVMYHGRNYCRIYKRLFALRKRILAIVFTFLLTIFPNSSYVLGCYQTYTYPGKHVITEQVMVAIINEDIDALIGMMSEESRNNIEDLPGKFREFIDAIDGEIIEYERKPVGSASDLSNNGVRISREGWAVEISTEDRLYRMYISWTSVNNVRPEEVGMQGIRLFEVNENDSENELLVKIHYTYPSSD